MNKKFFQLTFYQKILKKYNIFKSFFYKEYIIFNFNHKNIKQILGFAQSIHKKIFIFILIKIIIVKIILISTIYF